MLLQVPKDASDQQKEPLQITAKFMGTCPWISAICHLATIKVDLRKKGITSQMWLLVIPKKFSISDHGM